MTKEDTFTSIGRQARKLVSELTEYREREHREGSQQRPEEHDAEKQKCSDRENIRSELHLRSPV